MYSLIMLSTSIIAGVSFGIWQESISAGFAIAFIAYTLTPPK